MRYSRQNKLNLKKEQPIQRGTEFQLKPNPFTLVGYEFKNWNTKPDGSGISYENDEANLVFDENSSIYAQWDVITYSISYDMNGHGEIPKNAILEYTINDEYVPDIPSETGYVFTGWKPVNIPKGSTGDVKFTANWKDDIVRLTLVRNKTE